MKKIKTESKRYAAVILMIAGFIRLNGQGAYLPPEKPRLVIGIVVEQLKYDQLEKFRDRLGENGIKKLINEGTYFKNASFEYMLTQSAPGHATISTGAEPSYHGITSDSWYLPLKDELIDCSKDNEANPVGGTFEAGLHSPVNLQASTFSDELELSTNRKAKVFGIGLKESSAIFSAGHTADAAYWYDNTTGTWMTSSYYLSALPAWVIDFNAMKFPESYLNGTWNLLKPVQEYADCLKDSNNFELGFNKVNYFPYDLKKIRSKYNSREDFALLRETPFGNTFTTSFAIRLIEKEGLGKDDVTDYLSICYSANDYIGHRFGPSSVETGDAILRLDDEIKNLLTFLNDSIGKRNVLVYFTASHGVSELPSILESNHIPAGYFRQNQALQLLRTYLNAVYGEGDWVKGYSERQVFLNRTLIEDARLSLDDVQKKVARFLVQFTGVAAAYPYSAFEANDFGNGNLKRIINNFNPQRSGDVIVTLNPGWVEKEGDWVTNHNSPYEYDTHVPLIWYGWTVNRATVTRRVNMTDIAPTLSSLCKVPFPNACTGETLNELFR
ncbi:MAG TPA: alkaline phosphatase family protein [Bacteroidales bacterium]|mgnify:CR=1 FL=1|nr:alkaline phosphatase family protein [Bacteroidales bacterium]HPT21662.1 alkaline phosphatase family protein [Bacteroidales bacterium]